MCMWVHICMCVHFEFACDIRGKSPLSFLRYYLAFSFLKLGFSLGCNSLSWIDWLVSDPQDPLMPVSPVLGSWGQMFMLDFFMWLLDIEHRPPCVCSIIMLPKELWPSPIFSFIKLCSFLTILFMHIMPSSHPPFILLPPPWTFLLSPIRSPSKFYVCLFEFWFSFVTHWF